MSSVKVGDRVGAVCSSETTEDGKVTIEFFGFGVYQGREVPETEDVRLFGVSLKEAGRTNPCILLDNGKKVYGCECWWGPEELVRGLLEKADEVIEVDIEELRKEGLR